MAGTTNGDVIENLNITNAEQGEITFPITNRISKQDGIYSCQLAIYGADGFLEHTATFGLTVEANIFTKIAGEIENSKDLTYIERILEEAKTVSGELKTNIPVATNINSSLESNISSASNINTTLADTTEKSKVAATDAIEKKSQLEKSITKAKEFIDGLDGSQNIPGIRMELTELQNGLKSNQSLAYTGSSISANDTLEGRTEGMRIKGRTLVNLLKTTFPTSNFGFTETKQACTINDGKMNRLKPNTKYTFICLDFSDKIHEVYIGDTTTLTLVEWTTIKNKIVFTTPSNIDVNKDLILFFRVNYSTQNTLTIEDVKNMKCMIIEEEQALISYFKGIKSFGEAEQEGDKYKISILSNGKNLTNFENPIVDMNGTTHKLLDNGIKVTSSSDNHQMWCFSMLRVNVKENTDYYCSFKYKTMEEGVGWIAIRTTNDVLIKDFGLHEGVFNSGHNKEVVVQFYASLGTPIINNTVEYYDFQIEEGTQATQYEPYIEDKKDILIKEPLRGIGNISDVVYEDNGQVKIDKYVKQYTFTGDENVMFNNYNGDYILFYFEKKDAKKINFAPICNNFKGFGGQVSGNEQFEFINQSQNGNIFYINILKSKLTTQNVEGFKAWLKANSTTVIYQLDTPVTEIVENCVDIDLDTFGEKTYFNILNSLPGTLDFKVPSNIGSSLQNLAKEVNNIWDVINNLLVPSLIETNKNIAMATIKNNLK